MPQAMIKALRMLRHLSVSVASVVIALMVALLIDSFVDGVLYGSILHTLRRIEYQIELFMQQGVDDDMDIINVFMHDVMLNFVPDAIQAPIKLKIDDIIMSIPKNVAKINLLTEAEQQQMSATDAIKNAKQRYDEIFTCPILREIPQPGKMILLVKQLRDQRNNWVDINGCRWFYDKHSLTEWCKSKPTNPINRDKIEETPNTRYVVYKIKDAIPTTKSALDLESDELNLLINDIRNTIIKSISNTNKFFDKSIKNRYASNDESNIPQQNSSMVRP